MKRILYKSLSLVLVTVLALIGFTGCTKEYITEEYITEEHITNINGAEATNYYYEVGQKGNDWVWNDANGRYECTFELEELTNDIYNYGTMLGNVFVEPGLPGEWLELLPYQITQSYKDEKTGEIKTYSVMISCAFQPGEVKFIYQLSDGKRDDGILEPFEFKVTLLLDTWNLPEDN